MAYEQKNMSGALFKNARKEKDSHPDYQGDAMINGEKVRIAAWIKEGKNGKWMSLSFSELRGRAAPQSGMDDDERDSQVPF